jgi:hypothetical protein
MIKDTVEFMKQDGNKRIEEWINVEQPLAEEAPDVFFSLLANIERKEEQNG